MLEFDEHRQKDEGPPEKASVSLRPGRAIDAVSLTKKKRRIGERIVEFGIYAVAGVSILAILLIFAFVFREASPIFLGGDEEAAVGQRNYSALSESPASISDLLDDEWEPTSDRPRYGIYPMILGTAKTTAIALLIATPLGILAALFTAFFAPRWIREYLKPAIELLAAFPSIVIAFFCLMTVATVVQAAFGTQMRLNAVVGGIGLALAVIPIIFTITDDALRSVPRSLREAALALGASEWQAAYQVMLPAATPGIFAAVLLAIGRAFGETMIVWLAAGNASDVSWDIFVPVRTFAATIGSETGEVVNGSPHYQVLFFLGVLLFAFSFLINLVTEFYVKQRLIKRFRGTE